MDRPPETGAETAYIIHPVLTGRNKAAQRSPADMLEEAVGLAQAIFLEVAGSRIVNLARPKPGAFLGKGVREEVAAVVADLKPSVVIVNHTLSPVQQRNLEKEWKAKVIDRTGLILEIFGARAQTKEGKIQVELAALEYQKSRLVRSWTHLERQRGGLGKTGGPGETQIELDRRMIRDRIAHLKKELEGVRRTRDLGRKSRERVPYPVIALVGYTNAGKSTLFNTLTGAEIFAEDLLFATLDPTMRKLELPNGQEAILSDTVGFISDLPTMLVAAFRATLEQITYADVIVHVIDAAQPDHGAQREDVLKILKDLGIEEHDDRILETYNKIDILSPEARQDLQRKVAHTPNALMISAVKKEGLSELLQTVTAVLARARVDIQITLQPADGKALAWLYQHAEVLERQDGEEGVSLKVNIEPANLGKFKDRFGY